MCELCNSIKDEHRLIKETKYSFCIICKCPLRFWHLMVMPKRHVMQTNMNDLSLEESHDLMCLLNDIQKIVEDLSSESAIILKNNGKHMTQAHLHFHIFPSKWNLRQLVANYENLPERLDISYEKYIEMRDKIKQRIYEN